MTLKSTLYEYTECKAVQIVLQPTKYRFEVWGAQGGSYRAQGGKGGYAHGEIVLQEETTVFVHVGSQGSNTNVGQGSEGCNGGGYSSNSNGRSGGGGSDIRIGTDDLFSRIIVAGGGGGAGDDGSETGGYGGGETGGKGEDQYGYAGIGGNQKEGGQTCADGTTTYKCPKGSFGFGGNSTNGGGGGGGWNGGSGASPSLSDSGGGGSGYVLTSTSFKPQGYFLNDPKYFLTNTSLLQGNLHFINPQHTGEETGHSGNGFVRITELYLPPQTPKKTSIRTPPKTYPKIQEYNYFTFSSKRSGITVRDSFGKFDFRFSDIYESEGYAGIYEFRAYRSFCGFSFQGSWLTPKKTHIRIELSDDVNVLVDDESLLLIPGQFSNNSLYYSPNMKHSYSFNLNEYDFACPSATNLSFYFRPISFHKSCRPHQSFPIALLSFYLMIIHTSFPSIDDWK